MQSVPQLHKTPEEWIAHVFSARVSERGGMVRRKIRDVEREIGRERLELEVRRRGWHMIETNRDIIILCDTSPFRIIC